MSVKTTIHKRRAFFAVQPTTNDRLTHYVIFGKMTCGVKPGRGRPEKNWAQCLAGDIRVFEATQVSMDSSPLLFGVETILWPRAAKKDWNWQRSIVEAANRFMMRWLMGEAEKSEAMPHTSQRQEQQPMDAGGTWRGTQSY